MCYIFLTYLPYDICNIDTYADDTTHYSKSEQSCDLWQQLEVAPEHESNLPCTVYCSKKGPVI